MTVLSFPPPVPSPTATIVSPSLFVQPFLLPKQTFDYAALRQAFRARAKELDIDPATGSTTYQAAMVKALTRKADHYRRMRALVEGHARRYPLNYAGGSGEVDSAKVARQARRDWYAYSPYWVQGKLISTCLPDKVEMHGRVDSPTEFIAIANVRREAIALEEQRDVERTYNRAIRVDGPQPRRYYRMLRVA